MNRPYILTIKSSDIYEIDNIKDVNTLKIKNTLTYAIVILFWLAVWQLIYIYVGRDILFVSPLTVANKIIELLPTAKFQEAAIYSLFRIMSGFISGTAAGVLLGVLTEKIKTADIFLRPAQILIKTTPVASFIILALVWIKNEGSIPVLISFLMVLPIVWSNVSKGVESIDRDLTEMAEVFKIPFKKRLKGIYIPSVMKFFFPAFVTSLGLAWKAGIAAEVIVNPNNSIGQQLRDSQIMLQTDALFAWTTVVIILSVIMEKLMLLLLKKWGSKYVS